MPKLTDLTNFEQTALRGDIAGLRLALDGFTGHLLDIEEDFGRVDALDQVALAIDVLVERLDDVQRILRGERGDD